LLKNIEILIVTNEALLLIILESNQGNTFCNQFSWFRVQLKGCHCYVQWEATFSNYV